MKIKREASQSHLDFFNEQNQIEINRLNVEQALYPTLKAFSLSKKITNEQVIIDLLPSLANIEYFKSACFEGTKLNDFIKQATPFLSYESFQRGKTIFHHGDQGDKFYIVLKGIIGVVSSYIPKSEQEINDEIDIIREYIHDVNHNKHLARQNTMKKSDQFKSSKQLPLQQLPQGGSRTHAEIDYIRYWTGVRDQTTEVKEQTGVDTSQGSKPIFKKDQLSIENEALLLLNEKKNSYFHSDKPQICKYHKVFQYQAGNNFGELALTTDQARAATMVIMTEDAHLLSMTKQDFKRYSEKQMQAMNTQIEYFMKIFEGVSKQTIIKFTNNFHEHTFNTSTELWKQGDSPDFFFLIKQGRCELFRYVLHSDIVGANNDSKAKEHPNKRKITQHKKIILSTLSENSFIGTEDVIEGNKTRSYCCKITEVTTAYYMSADDFNSIKKGYPDIVKVLRQKYKVIGEYMSQRQVSIVQNQKQVLQQISGLGHIQPEPIERVTTSELKIDEKTSNVPDYIRSYPALILTKTDITNKNEQLHQTLVKRAQQNFGHDPSKKFNMISKDTLTEIEHRIQRKFQNMRGFSGKPSVKISSSAQSDILVHNLIKMKDKRNGEYTNYQRSVSDLFLSFGNVFQTEQEATSFVTLPKKHSIQQSRNTPLLLSRAFNPKYQDSNRLLASLHNCESLRKMELQSQVKIFPQSKEQSVSNIFQTDIRRLHSANKNSSSRVRKGISIQNFASQPSQEPGYLSGSRQNKSTSGDQKTLIVSPSRVQTVSQSNRRVLGSFQRGMSNFEIQ